ncbi:MAG: GNAT family N-acetyltransferase [Dehalococcoidia bacterium]|nr:GNAT family N-acetyltransferase [Dehalococcoidia bacterium]
MSRTSIQPTFRQAERSDARGIASIVFGILCEGGPPSGIDPMSRDGVLEWFDRVEDNGAFFVAEVNHIAAGFAAIEPDARDAGVGLLRVYVLKEFRQRGIGRELVQVAVEFARQNGFRAVRGFIPEENEEALSFFSAVAPLVQVQAGQFDFEL